MNFVINLRLGIGFDIEHNNDICHIIEYEDESETIVAFEGTIIKIPFFSIYIGYFEDLFEQ